MVCAGCVKGVGLGGLTESQLETHVAAERKKRLANAESHARYKENGKRKLANANRGDKYDVKKDGTKRWAAGNAKVKEETRAHRAAQQALGGVPTASSLEVLKQFETIKALIEPHIAECHDGDGVGLIIYVCSDGSPGFDVKNEGINQFRPRNGVPSVRILGNPYPHDITATAMNQHAPPGIELYNCKLDKIMAETLEEKLQAHFGPILDKSAINVKLWCYAGMGSLHGIAPYKVCMRTVPLPLPAGWSIRTTKWKGAVHARKNDVCQNMSLKKAGATATSAAGIPKPKPKPPRRQGDDDDIRRFFGHKK